MSLSSFLSVTNSSALLMTAFFSVSSSWGTASKADAFDYVDERFSAQTGLPADNGSLGQAVECMGTGNIDCLMFVYASIRRSYENDTFPLDELKRKNINLPEAYRQELIRESNVDYVWPVMGSELGFDNSYGSYRMLQAFKFSYRTDNNGQYICPGVLFDSVIDHVNSINSAACRTEECRSSLDYYREHIVAHLRRVCNL